MKMFTKKNALQALIFNEVLIMEKAYTKISLDEIQQKLKNDINKYKLLLNSWSKIEHLTKKDGSEYKNIKKSFSNCDICYDSISRPEMSISIKLNNGNRYSDYIFLYDSYRYYGKNKYPLESYNIGGGVINKYHILTIDETMKAIEEKKESIKKQIKEKEKVLSVSENLYYKYTNKMKALYNDLLEECKKDSNRIAFNCIREAIESTKVEW